MQTYLALGMLEREMLIKIMFGVWIDMAQLPTFIKTTVIFDMTLLTLTHKLEMSKSTLTQTKECIQTGDSSWPYPPRETPTAMTGQPGKRFCTCSITAARSSVFAAQYVRDVCKPTSNQYVTS